ncbi:MAG: DUF5615 family PIN-like protein [Acidobacteria bacterium]|nr:DUF5615 family PIN-like protein [Acidobacteriota bacterium]
MKILLDENFPLPLYHRPRADGYDVEHIIELDQRGVPDFQIRQRLTREELLFLTQDTEFEDVTADCRSIVIISRVPQNLPIQQRVDIWFRALQAFLVHPSPGVVFDLTDAGKVVAYETGGVE